MRQKAEKRQASNSRYRMMTFPARESADCDSVFWPDMSSGPGDPSRSELQREYKAVRSSRHDSVPCDVEISLARGAKLINKCIATSMKVAIRVRISSILHSRRCSMNCCPHR